MKVKMTEPNASSCSSASLDAKEFFQSLEYIPNYVKELSRDNGSNSQCAFLSGRRHRFSIQSKSFIFPHFSFDQILSEFRRFESDRISFHSFLLLAREKYPHISPVHCDMIYAYSNNIPLQEIQVSLVERKRNSDIFAEVEEIEVCSQFEDEIVDCARFIQLEYIFHHYALILECPSAILFLMSDNEHRYAALSIDLASNIARHFGKAERVCLKTLNRRKDEEIVLQDFLEIAQQMQKSKDYCEENMFKNTIFSAVDSSTSEV